MSNFNINKLIEGWRNHLLPPKAIKEFINKVSAERLTICKECPKESENAKKDGYTSIRPDLHCTECGCTLLPKVKSLSSECPLGKWKAQATEEDSYEIQKELENEEG